MRPIHDQSFRTDLRAFTLIETIISTALVGLVLVAALSTVGATARARSVQASQDRGPALAAQLLAEIVAARYEEPDDAVLFGRESGEVANSCADWDDVDDFHGWSQSPPCYKDGTPVPDAAGWDREVTVKFVDPSTLATAGNAETGLKLITAVVTSPDGAVSTMQAMRSPHGANEQPPTVETSYVTAVNVELRLGGSNSSTTTGINLVNHVTGSP